MSMIILYAPTLIDRCLRKTRGDLISKLISYQLEADAIYLNTDTQIWQSRLARHFSLKHMRTAITGSSYAEINKAETRRRQTRRMNMVFFVKRRGISGVFMDKKGGGAIDKDAQAKEYCERERDCIFQKRAAFCCQRRPSFGRHAEGCDRWMCDAL